MSNIFTKMKRKAENIEHEAKRTRKEESIFSLVNFYEQKQVIFLLLHVIHNCSPYDILHIKKQIEMLTSVDSSFEVLDLMSMIQFKKNQRQGLDKSKEKNIIMLDNWINYTETCHQIFGLCVSRELQAQLLKYKIQLLSSMVSTLKLTKTKMIRCLFGSHIGSVTYSQKDFKSLERFMSTEQMNTNLSRFENKNIAMVNKSIDEMYSHIQQVNDKEKLISKQMITTRHDALIYTHWKINDVSNNNNKGTLPDDIVIYILEFLVGSITETTNTEKSTIALCYLKKFRVISRRLNDKILCITNNFANHALPDVIDFNTLKYNVNQELLKSIYISKMHCARENIVLYNHFKRFLEFLLQLNNGFISIGLLFMPDIFEKLDKPKILLINHQDIERDLDVIRTMREYWINHLNCDFKHIIENNSECCDQANEKQIILPLIYNFIITNSGQSTSLISILDEIHINNVIPQLGILVNHDNVIDAKIESNKHFYVKKLLVRYVTAQDKSSETLITKKNTHPFFNAQNNENFDLCKKLLVSSSFEDYHIAGIINSLSKLKGISIEKCFVC